MSIGSEFGERPGRVFLALIGEGLGHRAEIFVQDGVETPFPSRRERLVRRFGAGLHHCVEVGFQHAREFVEIGFLGPIDIDDYIDISSFTHHPFYTQFIIEVPDNWMWGTVRRWFRSCRKPPGASPG